LQARQQVDGGEPRGPDRGDVQHDDTGSGGLQQRAHLVAQPGHLVTGDGAGQDEYGGCHGIHDR
jgi:hypothetical protein